MSEPFARTVHEVAVAGGDGVFATVHIFEGDTRAGGCPESHLRRTARRRGVARITTTASPSWVAWAEIEVLDVGG